MYVTDNIWSHMAMGIGNGDIAEVTLAEGSVAHPFTDVLNDTDYLLIFRPSTTPEEQQQFAGAARATVGMSKFSYLIAAIIGFRILLGRDQNYRIRISGDLITALLVGCWLSRRHGKIVAACAFTGALYVANVFLNIGYRKSVRTSRLHLLSSDNGAVRGISRFPGIRGPMADGMISKANARASTSRRPRATSPAAPEGVGKYDNSEAIQQISDQFEPVLRPALRDKGKRSFLEIIVQGFWQREIGAIPLRTTQLWSSLAATTAPPDAARPGLTLSGRDGYDALKRLEVHLDGMQSGLVARHSSSVWFLMLKGAEDCVRTVLPKISSGILRLASRAVATSHKVDGHWRHLLVPWAPTPKIISDIDQLLSLCLIKWNVEVAIRRVAKGQIVRLSELFAAVPVDGDSELESAIQLYDHRVARASAAYAAEWLGLLRRREAITGDAVIAWADLRRYPIPDQLTNRLLSEYDPYFPVQTYIEEFANAAGLMEGALRWDTMGITAVLAAAWETLFDRQQTYRNARGVWTQYGYITLERSSLHGKVLRLLREGCDTAYDAERLWTHIEDMVPRVLYPLGRRRLILDLSTASGWLTEALIRGSEGTLGGIWDREKFAKQVQDIINSSPWRPDDKFRQLIGRKVRADDPSSKRIDAVAMSRGTLILIAAEVVPVTEALIRGEPEALLSMSKRAEEAASNWASEINEFRHHYKLRYLNADLTKIDNLVVMPFVPFVHLGVATRLMHDLPHVASIEELLARIHSE